MGEGVVSDNMSSLHQFANDVRPLLHVAPDQKKRGVKIVAGQHVQQALGMGVVGSVIVRKRQLLGLAAWPGEGTAKPLAGRRHRLVARGGSGGSSGGGDDVGVHADRDCKCIAVSGGGAVCAKTPPLSFRNHLYSRVICLQPAAKQQIPRASLPRFKMTILFRFSK